MPTSSLRRRQQVRVRRGGQPRIAHRQPVPAPPPRRLAAEPATHCTYQASPLRRPQGRASRHYTPDGKASYQATIVTNRGDVVIHLLNAKATCTVNSFVYLAAKKYFNNTRCHRLTTSAIYVLQCGDPTGTGSGGPGYKFADENLSGARYTAGTVAMANAGPGHQRQPVLPGVPRLLVAAPRLHTFRHSRQRTENHPECGQGGHR